MFEYTMKHSTKAKRAESIPILSDSVRDKLDESLEKAVKYCIKSQHRNGSWMVVPGPRVFETALVGYALSCSPKGECNDAVARAKQWLKTAHYQNHSHLAYLVEKAVTSIFLGRRVAIYITADELTAPEYKSRMMLLFVLALYAGNPAKVVVGADAFCHAITKRFNLADQIKIKQWTRIEVAAVSLMLKARYHLDTDSDEALRVLFEAQDTDGGFFQNPVATALAYIALCEAAGESTERLKCKQYLLDKQQLDGTWRFCTSDVWDKVLTLRSFRGHPLFDKVALDRGSNFLIEVQNRDKGWAFSSSVESDNDTTSAAILALGAMSNAKDHCIIC